ncbi:MAG: SEL1-like repeat protein [Parvibaculum sp.]
MARMQLDLASTGQLSPESGSSDALYNLGLMYSTGTEVEPNLVMAHKWFNLAAMKGSEAARSYRAELAQEMSKEEIAEAQRQAREWLANQ